MHRKVRQPVIALNGGYRSEPVLHILKHLREYSKIKRRGRQLVIPHCHCKCGEHKHKNGGQRNNRYPAFLCEFRKPDPMLSYSIPYSEGYKQDNTEKKINASTFFTEHDYSISDCKLCGRYKQCGTVCFHLSELWDKTQCGK